MHCSLALLMHAEALIWLFCHFILHWLMSICVLEVRTKSFDENVSERLLPILVVRMFWSWVYSKQHSAVLGTEHWAIRNLGHMSTILKANAIVPQ